MSSDEEKPFYKIIGGICISDDVYRDEFNYYRSREHILGWIPSEYEFIELPFRFKDEELYDYYNDWNFRHLYHTFNELIQKTHKGYYLREDCIEPVQTLSEQKAFGKYETVYYINDYPDEEGNFDVSFMKRGMGTKPNKR